jgi:hypothetical protein
MHHVLRDSTHLIKLVEESPFAVRAPASSIRLITRDVEGLRSPLDITALAHGHFAMRSNAPGRICRRYDGPA